MESPGQISAEINIVPFWGRLCVDQGLTAREAFLAGHGFGPAHIWLVDDLLAGGQLETILLDYSPPPVPLSMLISPGRTSVARVKLLVDFLVKKKPSISGIEQPRTGN